MISTVRQHAPHLLVCARERCGERFGDCRCSDKGSLIEGRWCYTSSLTKSWQFSVEDLRAMTEEALAKFGNKTSGQRMRALVEYARRGA
jgi:hypothetical protein